MSTKTRFQSKRIFLKYNHEQFILAIDYAANFIFSAEADFDISKYK